MGFFDGFIGVLSKTSPAEVSSSMQKSHPKFFKFPPSKDTFTKSEENRQETDLTILPPPPYKTPAPLQIEDKTASYINKIYLRIANLEIKGIEDILNSRVITDEEKQAALNFYKHFEDMGYKDFLDSNPSLIRGMALNEMEPEFDYISYSTLGKNEIEIIKYARNKHKAGAFSEKHMRAIEERQDMGTPSEWFKYIDDYDKIPPDGLSSYSLNPNASKTPKEKVIEELNFARDLRECLEFQSIPNSVKCKRSDDISVFNNVKIGNKTLLSLLQGKRANPKKVLEILNNGASPVCVKFNNFIGTTLQSEAKGFYSGKIQWDIDVPKGSKGLFLCAALNKGSLFREGEFLLQAGTSLEIQNAKYENGTWYLKAKAVQD